MKTAAFTWLLERMNAAVLKNGHGYFCVAMGNALPHVKAEADYIAPSNDEDGVAAAIREFMSR